MSSKAVALLFKEGQSDCSILQAIFRFLFKSLNKVLNIRGQRYAVLKLRYGVAAANQQARSNLVSTIYGFCRIIPQ